MARHRANILPHRAATALITSGPFAVSRNPIYLGNVLLTVGLALAVNNAWLLPAAGLGAFLLATLAIGREETHLEAVFGSRFEAYKRRISRWFGWRRGDPRDHTTAASGPCPIIEKETRA